MARSFKIKEGYKYIMMNRKTLAGVGSLIALGTVVLAQTTPTLGTVRDAIKSEPHAWTVVVGKDAKASDVIGAADVLAALQTLTTKVEPIDLSAVKVVLERPIVVENSTLQYSSGVDVWNGTVTVNDTVYSYNVELFSQGRFTNYALNESGRLQLQNVGFKVNIIFNGSIDKLNNTKINVFGKDFYLTYYSDNHLELRRIPVEEVRVRYGEERTVLGKRVKLVDIYEKLGDNKIYVVLEVEGKTYEITSGETKVIEGLELTVVDAYVSKLDVTRSYVVLGVGGGEKYVLRTNNSDDKIIEDVNGNKIGTWSLSGNTLTLTFTKDYLFAGDSFDLPIFGGYRLVFKDYPLPLPGSEPVEIRSVRSETVDTTKYYYYSLKFGGYELPLIVDNSTPTPKFYVYSRDYQYSSSIFPSSNQVQLTPKQKALLFLGLKSSDNPVASRLFEVVGDYSITTSPTQYSVYVEFTDVLTGEKIVLTNTSNTQTDISLGNIKIGDKDVSVRASVSTTTTPITITLTFNAGSYTFETSNVWFITKNNGLVNITYDSTNEKANVTVNDTTFTLGKDGYISANTGSLIIGDITEGGVKYTIAVNTNNGLFVKYKKFFTDYAVVYVPKEAKSPETVIRDLMTEKVEKYEVSPGGKVEIENQTILVKELTGLPKETVTLGPALIGRAVLDEEAKTMDRLIVVGGPAVNEIAAALLNVPYPTYGDKLKEMGILSEGQGLIQVFDTPRVAVLLAGWEAEDTRAAARIFSLFLIGQYPELETRSKVIITGGLQAPTIQ